MDTADRYGADELAVLYEMTRDLAAQRDLPTLLDTIAERALALLAVPAGNIYLYDRRRQELEQVVGTSPVRLGTRLRLGEDVAGQVAQTRQPLLVRDYRTWANRSSHYEGIAITAMVGVPMLYDDDLIGVLVVAEMGTTTREFTEAEAHLLTLFAEQAASAVYSTRLFAEAKLLEHLERVRADFISTISHDLRTPLTAARAALGLLETTSHKRLQTDERQLLENARRNIERLGMQIDDLLAFNQIETQTMRLDRELVDLRDVVGSALSAVDPLIQGKGQVLEVDLPEPLLIVGDRQQLEQVAVNLLANAHRYTPPGTRITIGGHIEETDVHVSVSDNGPGLPVEDLDRIFKRFQHFTAAEGGSGLGLAIAQSIVELHGGRIWVESAPGQGTAFYRALPHSRAGESERH